MRPLFYLLFVLSFGWMLGGCSDDKEELAAPKRSMSFAKCFGCWTKARVTVWTLWRKR